MKRPSTSVLETMFWFVFLVIAWPACEKTASEGTGGSSTPSCPGATLCDGTCTATDSDPANCGACGNACSDGELCAKGACVSICPSGTDLCNGACVDAASDPKNCGQCGGICPQGELCSMGKCGLECFGGTIACDGKCVDTGTSHDDCGACGHACGAEETCVNGACSLVCVGGTTACNGKCVDVQTDHANCGQCGTACGPGELCSAGQCALTCLGGTTACNGKCVDVQTDHANCGQCGAACGSGELCSVGQCALTCFGGTTACNGKCVDVQTDQDNCGTCGNACGVQATCTGGTCVCTPAINNTNLHYTGYLAALDFGTGIDSLSASAVAHCVQFQPPSVPVAPAATRTFSMHFVQSSSELKKELGLSVNASYDTGFWGADASASFFKSSHVTTDSAYLVLDVVVAYAPEIVAGSVTLTDAAKQLMAQDPEGFHASCGDQWVYSITRGAIYRAIYQFSGVTEASKQDIAATFSVGGANWSVDASFHQAIDSVSSRYQTDLYVLQKGGSFSAVALTPSDLIAEAAQFGADPGDGGAPSVTYATAYPLAVDTKSYYATDGWLPGARYPDVTQQLQEIATLTGDYDKARLLMNDIDERLARPGRLDLPSCAADKQALLNAKSALAAYIASAQLKFIACKAATMCGPTQACLAPIAPAPPTEMPLLQNQVGCGPACTDGIGSTYESDNHGYCTRCKWTNATASNTSQPVYPVMLSTCRYLRRGANVTIRIQGTMRQVGDPGWNHWIDIWADGKSGSMGATSCNVGAPCRFIDLNHKSQTWLSFDVKNTIVVGATAQDSSVDAYITQYFCQGTYGNGCDYSGVTIDVCDADNPNGCQ